MISSRVVNASPLILLAKARHLELLRVGGLEVRVPDAVIAEVEAHGIDDPAAVAVRSAAWLQVVPTPTIPDRVASWSLGAGESGVLAVALEIPDCEVILDDRAARRCASVLGLPARGCVGLVLAGKTAGAIPAARPVLEALLRAGLYLPPDFVDEALKRVGE